MSNKLNTGLFGQRKGFVQTDKSTLRANEVLKKNLCFVKTASQHYLEHVPICPVNKGVVKSTVSDVNVNILKGCSFQLKHCRFD